MNIKNISNPLRSITVISIVSAGLIGSLDANADTSELDVAFQSAAAAVSAEFKSELRMALAASIMTPMVTREPEISPAVLVAHAHAEDGQSAS